MTHIDDDGFVRFDQVGGWDPVQLVGQRIVLDTRGGAVRGVIGRKAIHQLDEGERKQPPELKDMHIDIGAASGDEARGRVRIGDMGVIDVAPVEFPNNRVVSRSLDNRVGAYVAARVAQLVARGRRRTGRRAGTRGRAGGDRTERRTDLRLPAQAGRRDRGRRRPRQRHARAPQLGQETKHALGSGPVLVTRLDAQPEGLRAAV